MQAVVNKYTLLIVLLFSLIFSSCEKVIDLKLDQTTPMIVIEGIITDLEVQHLISISYTKNFDANNNG